MQTEDSKSTRKNSPPIKVYCLPEEARAIKAQARSVGLPVAAYLRNVGLGIEVRSVLDYRRIDDLAKINGDLGRLGGLLKLWLTNDERLPGIRTEEVRGVLAKIEHNQDALRAIIQKVLIR